MARRPRISITERNSQTAAILDSDPRYRKGIANPFGLPSEAIRLTEPGWYCRWVNNSILTDKVWRSKNVGYDNVKPADLADQEQLGMLQTDAAGCIVRGERGQEVLLKIPMAVRQAREDAKTARNLRDMRDTTKQREDLREAVGKQYGDQAADYLQPVGQVKTQYERIETTQEPGDE